MSLIIEVSKVKDWQKYCYQDYIDEKTKEKYADYNPATKYLAWGSMAIGIGDITEKNYRDVYLRHRFLNNCQASTRSHVSLEDVKRNIGLHTNVAYEPKGKWLNRIAKSVYHELEWNLERNEDE